MANPIIWADVPDVDAVRVGNWFYMTSTSMHMMPGVPVMRSSDLVNWEIVSYVYETLEDSDSHRLTDGKGIYGRGSWATSLRHHKGTFYVCFCAWDTGKTYVFTTPDIERGPWQRAELGRVFHDASLLFDDDGRVYLVYGNGEIRAIELTTDASAIMAGGVDQVLFRTPDVGRLNAEGSHAYKIDGAYYVFLIQWPEAGSGRRQQLCYRSEELLRPYEGRVVLDDDIGYRNHGVAQGGVVSSADGVWYALLFQDHDAVGRVPVLVPVAWVDGWPVMGRDGRVPPEMDPVGPQTATETALLVSDDFCSTRLGLTWQWNHNPDNANWSLTERPGYLRLAAGTLARNVLQARNTLSQRTVGPTCSADVELHVGHMKPGDSAGLAAFQSGYGMVGVKAGPGGRKQVLMATNDGTGDPEEMDVAPLTSDTVHLRVAFNFADSRDEARFYYSTDGAEWQQLGTQLAMEYTLDHFMGYRVALFNYATLATGGYVDFAHFRAALPAADARA